MSTLLAGDRVPKYKTEIQQMMFVSGETAEPAAETTTLIEHIVQQQVQEMLRECSSLATRRGSKSIAPDDLMMLIRHDKAKLSRLRHFLQWKDVRKNVKDSSDDKAGTDAGDIAAGDEALGAGIAGPTELKRNKKARVDLVWDVASFFNETVPPRDDEEEEEEEEEMNLATLQRLKSADERTKNMSREDYMHWSECRQASFTFRKGKRFREWAGFAMYTDSKPNDDIIDILGFLTFEIVQTLTEEALNVKRLEDLFRKRSGTTTTTDTGSISPTFPPTPTATLSSGNSADSLNISKGSQDVACPTNGVTAQQRKRKREPGLFDWPEEIREPVQTSHVLEAFRRLQCSTNKSRAMLNFTPHIHRTPLKLI